MPRKPAPRPNRPRVRHPAPRPPATTAASESGLAERPNDTAAPALPAAKPARPLASSRLYRPARASGATMITDYRYVGQDLRRILVLAGTAFVVLLSLTFVVH